MWTLVRLYRVWRFKSFKRWQKGYLAWLAES
jgi:hypothetical protein